jgi:DNA-directed RNA polymerase subunit RPC12/RpoP
MSFETVGKKDRILREAYSEKSNNPPPIPPPYPPRWFEGVCADCGREWSVTFIHDTNKNTTKWVCNQCNRKLHYKYIDCDLAKKGLV